MVSQRLSALEPVMRFYDRETRQGITTARRLCVLRGKTHRLANGRLGNSSKTRRVKMHCFAKERSKSGGGKSFDPEEAVVPKTMGDRARLIAAVPPRSTKLGGGGQPG